MRRLGKISRGALIAGMLLYASSVPVFGAAPAERSDSSVNKISRITINGQVYEITGDADIHVNGEVVTIKNNAGDMVISSGNMISSSQHTDFEDEYGNDGSQETLWIVNSDKVREEAQREAQKAREEAQREAQKARETAQREAQKARETALREAQKAREIAQREAQKARETAQREAQKAREEAQRQAQKAREEAQKARETAQREAQKAREQSRNVSASSGKPWHNKATLDRTEALNRDVTRLVSNIAADVNYTHFGQPGVHIAGPQASVSAIEVIREGQTVKLSYNKKLNTDQSEGLTITVSGIELTSVTLSGAGDFTADNLAGTNVEIKVLGAGDVRVKDVNSSVFRAFCSGAGDIIIDTINSTNTTLNTSGAGDIKIGTVNSDIFRSQLSGAGDVKIDKLPATSIELNANGAGDITIKQINATSVKAYLNGVGDIRLSGITTLANLFCTGVGTIFAKELKASRVSKSVSGTGDIEL